MDRFKDRARTIVLSDLDDTLVDRGTYAWEAMKATFANSFNIDVSLEEIAGAQTHDTLTTKYGCDWERFWREFDRYDDREEAISSGKISPYHDALGALRTLSKSCEIAITTDTPPPKAYPEIYLLGIHRHIDAVISYVLGHKKLKFKPDISVALRAFDAIRYKPRHHKEGPGEPDPIWVIGDGLNDMEFAENIRGYLLENNYDAQVHSIYIHRRGPTDIKHDFRTFGPSPLWTAAQLILGHQRYHAQGRPIEVCWPETDGINDRC